MRFDIEEFIWGRLLPFLGRLKRPWAIATIIAIVIAVVALIKSL